MSFIIAHETQKFARIAPRADLMKDVHESERETDSGSLRAKTPNEILW